MDKRALFFVGAAVVSLLLVPATPDDLRWFPLVLALVYVVLAAASALDNYSRTHHRRPRS